jgi:hypothetical protein
LSERIGRAALMHPIALGALATWIVNDHYAKAAHGGVVTGKLSDVACLIVVPLIAIALWELWRPASRRVAIACIVATGVVMFSINLFDPAAWLYRHGLGTVQWPLRVVMTGELPAIRPAQLTMDPTDLLTLPALLVPALLLRRAQLANERGLPVGVVARANERTGDHVRDPGFAR